MQLKHAMVSEIVLAGERNSYYSPPTTAVHKQLVSVITDLAASGELSAVNHGHALKALSGGNNIDLQTQIGANLRYIQNADESVSTDAATTSIKHELRHFTERLKDQLRQQNYEKTIARQKAEQAQIAQMVDDRRRREKELHKIRQEREKEFLELERKKFIAEQYKKSEERQRMEALRNRLKPWLEIVNSLNRYPKYEVKITAPTLESEDRALAKEWFSPGASNPSYENARLLSARLAERAAAAIYEKAGFPVVDVSATQLSDRQSKDWKQFDLLVNNEPVDVKNARASLNSPKNYVEHCVPQFKTDRSR